MSNMMEYPRYIVPPEGVEVLSGTQARVLGHLPTVVGNVGPAYIKIIRQLVEKGLARLDPESRCWVHTEKGNYLARELEGLYDSSVILDEARQARVESVKDIVLDEAMRDRESQVDELYVIARKSLDLADEILSKYGWRGELYARLVRGWIDDLRDQAEQANRIER